MFKCLTVVAVWLTALLRTLKECKHAYAIVLLRVSKLLSMHRGLPV